MAKIDSNSLKNEELIGGFEPTDSGDSFILESYNKYPGDLPKFEQIIEEDVKTIEDVPPLEESVEQPDVINEEIPKTEDIVPNIPIIEDSTKDIQDEVENKPLSPAPKSEDEPIPNSLDINGSVWDIFDTDKETNPEQKKENKDSDYLFSEEEPDSQKSVEDSQSTEIPTEATEAGPSSFEMNDDMKELLAMDIEQRKLKKSRQEAEKDESEQDDIPPVDAPVGEETFINITDIEADKPSRYGKQEQAFIPILEQETLKNEAAKKGKKIKAPKKVKEAKVQSEEKIKKPLSRKNKILLLIAAILLLTVGAGAYIYFFNKPWYNNLSNNFFGKFFGNKTIDTNQIVQATKPIAQNKKIDSSNKKNLANQITKESKKEPDNQPAIEPLKKIEPKISKPASNQNKSEISKEKTNKDLLNKGLIKPLIKQKQIIKDSIPKKIHTKTNNKSSIIPVEQEFTVQVYSTPYKDDAEEWLKYLNKKGVTGFITEQKIRDKNWFRVRFGAFKSFSEAKSAALKYGFEQSWVDRVK